MPVLPVHRCTRRSFMRFCKKVGRFHVLTATTMNMEMSFILLMMETGSSSETSVNLNQTTRWTFQKRATFVFSLTDDELSTVWDYYRVIVRSYLERIRKEPVVNCLVLSQHFPEGSLSGLPVSGLRFELFAVCDGYCSWLLGWLTLLWSV